MIYLASPFSHEDKTIERSRFHRAYEQTVFLLRHKVCVFSPIAYGYQFYQDGHFAGDYETWRHLDEDMIRSCGEIWILELDGWKQSKGVRAEVEFGLNLGKPVGRIEQRKLSPHTWTSLRERSIVGYDLGALEHNKQAVSYAVELLFK